MVIIIILLIGFKNNGCTIITDLTLLCALVVFV